MNAVQTRPSMPYQSGMSDVAAPPAPSNIGNDLTHLNDTLGRVNSALSAALDRLRGPRPEVNCPMKDAQDVSLRARLNQAEHAAEGAESLAKEILGLLGE